MFRRLLLTAATASLLLTTPACAHETGDSFKDCETCPEMVVVPSGKAMIGAEPYEANRKRGDDDLREVTIAYRLAVEDE